MLRKLTRPCLAALLGAGALPSAGSVSEVQNVEAAAVARGVPAHPADHEVNGLNDETSEHTGHKFTQETALNT